MKLYKEKSYYIAHLRINNWKQSFKIPYAMHVIDLPLTKRHQVILLGEFNNLPDIESMDFVELRFYHNGYTIKIKWKVKKLRLIKEIYYNIRYKLERW